jgi:hypothetical protein
MGLAMDGLRNHHMSKPKVETVVETTLLCEAPKMAEIDKSSFERCRECPLEVWRNKLCYEHFREKQGFEFDSEQKLFKKRKK